MMDLTALKMGSTGRIAYLTARDGMLRRLMDLGFTCGAQVSCLLSAPGDGMRAYRVRGAVVALRLRDARNICLEDESHA